jgi:hypothetical protein
LTNIIIIIIIIINHVMELGHLLTRFGLMYPEVSSQVCHDSFCQLGNSVSLPWNEKYILRNDNLPNYTASYPRRPQNLYFPLYEPKKKHTSLILYKNYLSVWGKSRGFKCRLIRKQGKGYSIVEYVKQTGMAMRTGQTKSKQARKEANKQTNMQCQKTSHFYWNQVGKRFPRTADNTRIIDNCINL